MERTVSGESTGRLSLAKVAHPLAEPGGTQAPRLVVLTGEDQGRRIPLEGPVIVGRSDECAIQLDDAKVSRRHARFEPLKDGSWLVVDLGSRNGTSVNGEQLIEPRVLRVGDRVQLSHDTMLLFTRQDPLEDLLLHRQQMEVIGQLAAGIAHDFNNLLNVVLASMSHLEGLPPATRLGDKEVRECHADVQAAAHRAAELTGRLLGLARRRKRKRKPTQNSQLIDVSRLCQDVLELVDRTFDRSIQLEHHVEPNLTVSGDYAALHQVLMNLCINARDAMRAGGRLTLRGSLVPAAPDGTSPNLAHVVVTVEDTGVGMDSKTAARVFEPFFSTKESGAGSGLGLATVYEVVTSHGGTVEVESEVGRGSVFRVRLPARVSRPPVDASRTADRRRAVSHAKLRKPESMVPPRSGVVMVVDDHELVRRSLGRLVKAAGHAVIYAGDGQEAIDRYVGFDRRPDVVLLDLDMPRLAGEETLSLLLQLDGTARVILVSGYHDDQRRHRLLEAGATDFLPKPVDPKELLHAIEGALEQG
ncbi:MAG: response regulator [Sandaracinaceae bacterium]